MSELGDAALGYVQRGWHVFPLHGIVRGRCTCARRDCSSPGKHPLTRHGLKDASTAGALIEQWWARWPAANVAVATGESSQLVVVDVDLPRALESIDAVIHKLPRNEPTSAGPRPSAAASVGKRPETELQKFVSRLPITLTSLTGGGGLHLLYRGCFRERVRNRTSSLPGMPDLPGIDLRGDGGYVVAPPSVHRSGNAYSWLNPTHPIAELPSWLIEPAREANRPSAPQAPRFADGDGTAYGLAALADEVQHVRSAPVGSRNHTLNRAAFCIAQLVAGGELSESAARSSLFSAATGAGLPDQEICQTIGSGFHAGLRQARTPLPGAETSS